MAPEFLTIGHIAQDVLPDGRLALGGTVTYAALTAARLGLSSAIVTAAEPAVIESLPAQLEHIEIEAHSSTSTTTFANRYIDGFRIQYLYHRARTLVPDDIPDSWRPAPIVLLGPLAQELDARAFLTILSRRTGAVIAATPQGWLRRWDSTGRVWPVAWQDAERILPQLDVLILSHDDLLPFAEGERDQVVQLLSRWSELVPLLVATDGRNGATLFRDGRTQQFPAYPVQEVDPTGAGDVFAAAFLTHLYRHHEVEQAINFANCAASFAVERVGIEGIPTLEMVQQRLR